MSELIPSRIPVTTAASSSQDQLVLIRSGGVSRIGVDDYTKAVQSPSAITVSGTVDADSRFEFIDATSGDVTRTLPAASDSSGRLITFKKEDSSGNSVTIAAASGETIDDEASQVISFQWNSMDVVSDGSEWFIV